MQLKPNYVFLFLCTVLLASCQSGVKSDSNGDKALEKAELKAYYQRLLADPATGNIPRGIRQMELDFAQTLPVYYQPKRGEDMWKSRGPVNQGGRTRCIVADAENPKRMIAGSVTGGIYISDNGGKSWSRCNTPVLSVTCLVQDTRPGKTKTWYAGTGELYGSSGSAGGAYYLGQGIMKSTDGGNTWSVLSSTTGNSPVYFDYDFDGVWNIALDLSNTAEDEVYAATYGGIYKSLDGGKTWKKKRSGAVGTYSYCTDVAVTSTGVVYATMSSESSHKGIWRSPDGEAWTSITPVGFPPVYGRMCIGIAPSDETQVYIVATETDNYGLKSTNFVGTVEWNSLWKYDYVSGTGSGSGGRWINKSMNLPDKGGDFGYYSSQQGYNLYVRVKPNDTNVVFIGVTNLWRSSDAFRSKDKTDWIGGYDVNTSRPDFKLYPNHHPDNHFLLFADAEGNKAYSAHDGGISYTDNIMAGRVIWQDCNSGYISTQFYTVALDYSAAMDFKIMGGTQDNGTQFMNAYGPGSWHLTFNGDGSYGRFKGGSNELYASAQQGRIAHLEIDSIGRPLRYARIDPAQLSRSSYDFINPFVLDPNKPATMYLPAKRRLFRNSNIDAKPLTAEFDSTRWNTPLWEELPSCVPPTGHEFSAIAVSAANPHTLYCGTDKGKLYRINHADTGMPQMRDISGSNFPTGNINCIALDPQDSNRITVVFSNYAIISLFSSSNGGASWQNISGNLEENANGSGAGPSCRWASVLTLANGNKCWFVGTSTGLFATDTLNGTQTRWMRQSPEGIGYNIVTMIDVRQVDYTVAVATHGNGVYTANIASPWQITGLRSAASAPDVAVFPNPLSGPKLYLTMSRLPSENCLMEILGTDGRLHKTFRGPFKFETGNRFALDFPELPAGIYLLRIRDKGMSNTRRILYTGL